MASKSSDSIEEARAAVFTAVEACDIVGARAALECLRHLEGDSPNPPGHAGSVGDDSVDALTGMAATAIHCSGSDATACVKRLADVQTKLASIDSQIRQAREQQKKALEEVNIDEVERLDHVATRLYKDRTPLEETLARLLNGLIGCVARVLIRSGPKLERLKKELNVKVSLKDFTAAKMIGTNIKAIQRCVEQVKPVAAALRRGIELTDATLSMLKMMVGVSASECRAVGLTPLQLKAAKFTLKELKAAKFTLAELKTAKYTFAEIKAAKFTFAELKAAKFTAAELKAAKFPIAECMILPGIFRSDLERAGFNVDAMKAHDKAVRFEDSRVFLFACIILSLMAMPSAYCAYPFPFAKTNIFLCARRRAERGTEFIF